MGKYCILLHLPVALHDDHATNPTDEQVCLSVFAVACCILPVVLLIVLLKMLAVLGLPFPLHTAIVIATACSSQCVCLVRLGLLLCPTRLAGVVGIGTWSVFWRLGWAHGLQSTDPPLSKHLLAWWIPLGGGLWLGCHGDLLLLRRVFLLSCYFTHLPSSKSA